MAVRDEALAVPFEYVVLRAKPRAGEMENFEGPQGSGMSFVGPSQSRREDIPGLFGDTAGTGGI